MTLECQFVLIYRSYEVNGCYGFDCYLSTNRTETMVKVIQPNCKFMRSNFTQKNYTEVLLIANCKCISLQFAENTVFSQLVNAYIWRSYHSFYVSALNHEKLLSSRKLLEKEQTNRRQTLPSPQNYTVFFFFFKTCKNQYVR